MKAIWIRGSHALFDVTQFAAFYVKESSGGKYWYICGGMESGKEIRLDYAESEKDAKVLLRTLHWYLEGDAKAPTIDFATPDGFVTVGELQERMESEHQRQSRPR